LKALQGAADKRVSGIWIENVTAQQTKANLKTRAAKVEGRAAAVGSISSTGKRVQIGGIRG